LCIKSGAAEGKERSAGAHIMISDSEANDLCQKMCQARKEWECASENFQHAVQLSQDLEGNPDGVSSVKAAATHEVEALKRYRVAVQEYAKSIRASRRP
jgi:hypothetical protein